MTTPNPLARKLQIKPDSRLLLLGAPDDFAAAIEQSVDQTAAGVKDRNETYRR
ncbi:hypothetical protein [Sorangium sp. So ce1335]|uniref:hypothetical protein n=1 Tax=Sorangium sp. So ce1335 TaxID=3133335 RepID=UPI003F5DF775